MLSKEEPGAPQQTLTEAGHQPETNKTFGDGDDKTNGEAITFSSSSSNPPRKSVYSSTKDIPYDENLKARSRLDVVQTSNPLLSCEDYSSAASFNPFRDYLLGVVRETGDESLAFQVMSLLQSIIQNDAVDRNLLKRAEIGVSDNDKYSEVQDSILGWLISLCEPCQPPRRIVTIQMAVEIMKDLVSHASVTQEKRDQIDQIYAHFAKLISDRFQGSLAYLLLDLYEDELPLLRRMLSNSDITNSVHLLPFEDSAQPGLQVTHRRPEGDVENIRRDVQHFILLRQMRRWIHQEASDEDPLEASLRLPLVTINSELEMAMHEVVPVTCAVGMTKVKLFMVLDSELLILVEKHPEKAGWANVKCVASVRHQEAFCNRSNTSVLHITIRSAIKPHASCRKLKVRTRSNWATIASARDKKTFSRTDDMYSRFNGIVQVGTAAATMAGNALQQQRDKPLWNLTLLFQGPEQVDSLAGVWRIFVCTHYFIPCLFVALVHTLRPTLTFVSVWLLNCICPNQGWLSPTHSLMHPSSLV